MAKASAEGLGIRDEVAALKKARITSAAMELFYENGYENTTLEAVAERLKVTKPFIYAHFSSKTELLAEICARGISESQQAMNGVISLDLPATERLRLLAQRFVEAVLDSQMHIAIFSREEKNLAKIDFERISEMRRDFDRKLTALLKEGMGTGEFRIQNPNLAALAIGGMVSWAYVWYREEGRLTRSQIAEEFARYVLNLVDARDAAAS